MIKAPADRRPITMERTYDASLEDVWALWTTKEGLESWWGPEGFRTTVHALDLRPGGEARYDMTAVGAAQIAHLERLKLPTTTKARLVYRQVEPRVRLAYTHFADFIPDVEPYDIETLVVLAPAASGVRMSLTFQAMHDEPWTRMATQGWEEQLGRLGKAVACPS